MVQMHCAFTAGMSLGCMAAVLMGRNLPADVTECAVADA